MEYRLDKYGRPVSILGYGCMRFTRKGGGIDLDKAQAELTAAIEGGVNYLDTAYIYPGSEAAVGDILRRTGLRDRVNLATKLPQYLIKSSAAIDKYFNEQLRRLQTDHVDYYLMHMLTDLASWEKLRRLGVEDWIQKQKAAGRIRNLGFSFHGNTQTFLSILDAYDWDFCQIQYNYMDETSQAGRKGLEAAQARGIPVIIMEPLRGGKLVNMLPKDAQALISAHPSGRTAAEWALRWLWDQAGVTCVLSGMNSLAMVQENLRITADARPGELTPEDHAFIARLKEAIARSTKIGCTGCGYCQPCPRGVDIPAAFRCYNELYLEAKGSARREYMQLTALKKEPTSASRCIGCGKCETHCPQHLPIRQGLRQAAKELETPVYKLACRAVQIFKLW